MEYLIGFILAVCGVAALVASFTNIAHWIGLGFLALFGLSVFGLKGMPGDLSFPWILGVMLPLAILSAAFFLAAGIRWVAILSGGA